MAGSSQGSPSCGICSPRSPALPVTVEEVAAAAGGPADEVGTSLTILEIRGYVTTTRDGRVMRMPGRPADDGPRGGRVKTPAGIRNVYVHAPFCARRCCYCDFAVEVNRRPDSAEWLAAIRTELEWAQWNRPRPGGTIT